MKTNLKRNLIAKTLIKILQITNNKTEKGKGSYVETIIIIN